MITEKWDILDKDGNPTGKTTVRGSNTLKNGEYHLVVHIWIVSNDGKFLIQKRSLQKKLMPGEWAATGGAAITGESSYTAANRELYEELGIKSNKQTLKKLCRIKRRNSFLDVWYVDSNTPAEDLRLQRSEVAEAKWISKDELVNMINNKKFHNYGDEYFETIFQKIDELRGNIL